VTARAFCACWPAPAAADALQRWPVGNARRADVRDLHLTLHFLGAVSMPTLPALGALLGQLPSTPFVLRLCVAEFWPAAGVVVALPEAIPTVLSELHAELGQRLTTVLPDYTPPPTASFRPHLTLTQRAQAFVPAVAAGPPVEIEFDAVTLALTAPEPGGPRYRALVSERLRGRC
jgi:2'-5' RNA ligase